MSVTKEQILEALNRVQLPNGETLVSRDMIRAVSINDDVVQFVIEA
ncbi:MAG: ATP-binding protein involved in chromosome partitioning, partial [Ascidiaceihabitans sp.]